MQQLIGVLGMVLGAALTVAMCFPRAVLELYYRINPPPASRFHFYFVEVQPIPPMRVAFVITLAILLFSLGLLVTCKSSHRDQG